MQCVLSRLCSHGSLKAVSNLQHNQGFKPVEMMNNKRAHAAPGTLGCFDPSVNCKQSDVTSLAAGLSRQLTPL